MPLHEANVQLRGREFVAKFDLRTIASIDDATSKGTVDLANMLANTTEFRVDVAIRFIWGALRVLHPKLTLDELSGLIELDDLQDVLLKIATPWTAAVTGMFRGKPDPKAETTGPAPTGGG